MKVIIIIIIIIIIVIITIIITDFWYWNIQQYMYRNVLQTFWTVSEKLTQKHALKTSFYKVLFYTKAPLIVFEWIN